MINTYLLKMDRQYPFKTIPPKHSGHQTVLVHKPLPYSNPSELELIQQMTHFLQANNHPSLVNLVQVRQEKEEVHLYYEHVPLQLEGWLLEVNQNLGMELEEQLIELADFLTRSSINFTFDPENLGITLQMKPKYFLNEFTITLQNQKQHFNTIRKTIKHYFDQLLKRSSFSLKNPPSERILSLSTNGSASNLSKLSIRSEEDFYQDQSKNRTKAESLQAKINRSKERSMKIIQQFKQLKNN